MNRITSADVVWLLVLEWAGQTYYLATKDAEVDGQRYQGRLIVEDYSERLDFCDPTVQAPTATVSFWLDFGVSTQRAWLRSATAELSIWREGTAFSARSVRIRGRIRNPAYNTEHEPVTVEIVPDGAEDLAQYPPAVARVTEETFPGAINQGHPYPYIYGQPSHAACVIIDESGTANLVIAGHHVAVQNVRVVLVDEFGGTSSSTRAATAATDDLDQAVTICTASGLGAAASVYIDWTLTTGGRIPGGGMGDCVIDLLERSSITWDRAAWLSARDELNQYKVAFYLDSPSSPWDTAKQALLSLAPVSIRSGPLGVYPVIWDVFAESGDVAIEHGRNAWRVGGVEEDDDNLANSHRMDYLLGADGATSAVAVVDRTVSHACIGSSDEFGELFAQPIESRSVESGATATRALLWRAHVYAYPWRTVTYATSDARLASLLPGDVVGLTDSELGFDAIPAHVVGIAWDAGAIAVTLTIIHRP